MNFLKNASIKTRYRIFNILMTISGICIAFEILYDSYFKTGGPELTWLLIPGFAFFLAGFVYRLTQVKCPFCGQKLLEFQKAPDACPSCRESAFKAKENEA